MILILFLFAQTTLGGGGTGLSVVKAYVDGEVLSGPVTYKCILSNADNQIGDLVVRFPEVTARAVGVPIDPAASPKKYLFENVKIDRPNPEIIEDKLGDLKGFSVSKFSQSFLYSKIEMDTPEQVRRQGDKVIRTFSSSLRLEIVEARSAGRSMKLHGIIRSGGTVVSSGYCSIHTKAKV